MELKKPAPLLFAQLEQSLAPLDELDRSHWLGGLTHSQGSLESRLATLVGLRQGLAAGSIPVPALWQWPTPTVAESLCACLAELKLAEFCRGRGQLADTVVLSLLFHFDFVVDFRDRGASESDAQARALEAFAEDWRQRCGQMEELEKVFGLLPGDGENMNWDQLRGLLRSSGWQEVLRLSHILKSLPELAALIERLGRARETEAAAPETPRPIRLETRAEAPGPQARVMPPVAGETRGIQRSDQLARMLPAEAILLRHPRLRLVWHSKRAEQALLSYETQGPVEMPLPSSLPQPLTVPGLEPGRRRENGPLLVCVDTSGSMQGGAETVAKAVVLEAMRLGHAQGRPCHVFAFGGPGEVIDLELGFDSQGLTRLTQFLAQGFRGGTDICGPLEKALAKLEQGRWRQADLLLASDGQFGATPQLVQRLEAAKQHLGLRVQGVLLGDRETLGLLEIADAVFPVRNWRHFSSRPAEDVASPVHTHRLTALYFPGALRNAENRAATVSPQEAAAVVLGGRR